jgi:hypothetical protein
MPLSLWVQRVYVLITNTIREIFLQKSKLDIKDSIVMIADISGANLNVLYEVGFSHGIGKPTNILLHTFKQTTF